MLATILAVYCGWMMVMALVIVPFLCLASDCAMKVSKWVMD